MDKNHINLCLSGQSFRIVTDDDVDYVKQLEKRINSRIESYKKRYPQMSATRCTLLAMLELEDELARAKENYEALDAKISQLRNMPRINTPAARMPTEKKCWHTLVVYIVIKVNGNSAGRFSAKRCANVWDWMIC